MRTDLFNYIESELLALEDGLNNDDLKDAKTNEYGRADKAAAWALLSRLYLNANVYTGTNEYTDAIKYAKKVIDAPYSLISNYRWLFLANNHATGTNEIIFPITFDGSKSRTWGGTTYLVHAPIVGSMNPATHGVDFGWGGIRTTKQFVQIFGGPAGDQRMNFYTSGQNLEIVDVGQATDGYGIIKFRNVTSTGANGSNLTWTDTDYPVFRLAEMYLNYAEAVLRGGSGGDAATALNYINLLRQRAYGNSSGNITSGDLNLQFILNERAKELHWEAVRRTDLIRYGQFTEGTYLWAWKGNTPNGQAVASYRNLYPLPASDIVANPNLVQNTGY